MQGGTTTGRGVRDQCELEEKKQGIKVSDELIEYLLLYAWPGNIRQLSNEIRRMVYACAEGQAIDSRLLHPTIRGSTEPIAALRQGSDLQARVDRFEGALILEALARTRGSQRQAAKLLGVSRNGLAAKIKRLGIGQSTESGNEEGP